MSPITSKSEVKVILSVVFMTGESDFIFLCNKYAVVVLALVAIIAGIFLFGYIIERKVSKLEKMLFRKNEEDSTSGN